MGTRADFYVGRGKKARWIGSIAWDGNPACISEDVLKAVDASTFELKLREWALVDHEGDFTRPHEGWPWPWEDSNTTDYAYALDKGKVWASCFGSGWFDPLDKNVNMDKLRRKVAVFPDMRKVRKVTHGSRSGVIFVGRRRLP